VRDGDHTGARVTDKSREAWLQSSRVDALLLALLIALRGIVGQKESFSTMPTLRCLAKFPSCGTSSTLPIVPSPFPLRHYRCHIPKLRRKVWRSLWR